MTENEIIKELESCYKTMSVYIGNSEECRKHNEAISKAIDAVEEIQKYRSIGTVEKCNIYKRIAETTFSTACLDMKIIDELHEYKNIRTVEGCRDAVERQKAKISDVYGDGYSDGQLVYDMYSCPNCGESYEIDYDHYEYCPKCGQHMGKSDEVFE